MRDDANGLELGRRDASRRSSAETIESIGEVDECHGRQPSVAHYAASALRCVTAVQRLLNFRLTSSRGLQDSTPHWQRRRKVRAGSTRAFKRMVIRIWSRSPLTPRAAAIQRRRRRATNPIAPRPARRSAYVSGSRTGEEKFTEPPPCVILKPLANPAGTGEISDGLLMKDDTATL